MGGVMAFHRYHLNDVTAEPLVNDLLILAFGLPVAAGVGRWMSPEWAAGGGAPGGLGDPDQQLRKKQISASRVPLGVMSFSGDGGAGAMVVAGQLDGGSDGEG